MSNPSGPAHRNVASIRSPEPTKQGTPASPHTPLRGISSAFGSPSALRAEEDCVIIELGSRYFRAGFAGDAVPKAVVDFGPEEQRRAGDYRQWKTGYEKEWRKRIQGKEWGEAYELWRPDLRELDLGLVGDKIDRALREAFAKYLLIDSRPRRLLLALPSQLPLPLLSTILDTLFTNYQPPTISLMSAPALATVAAGLRASLVVDIGWAETVVTSIYEYREVQCARSVRAGKLLGYEMFKMLTRAIDPTLKQEDADGMVPGGQAASLLSFEECEEVVTRLGWCKSGKKPSPEARSTGLAPVNEEDELRASVRSLHISGEGEGDHITTIPLTSTKPHKTLQMPFSKLAEPCENALFASGKSMEDLDDEELPIHVLVYRSLLKLPMDVRSPCMARIVFAGGVSNLTGLKGRILSEVGALIEERGWDPVYGKAVEQLQNHPKLQKTRNRQTEGGPTEIPGIQSTSASQLDQEHDPIEVALKREARKVDPPVEAGNLRAIGSLGSWAGGSMLSHLKIPAVSVIERESWLQHGASGAKRDGEISISTQRQSMGPGAFKSGAGDRSSWTLGLWG